MVVQVLQLGEFSSQEGLFQVQAPERNSGRDPTAKNDESPQKNESPSDDGIS